MSVSKSGSVTAAKHVNVELVSIPVEGESVTELMMGNELPIITDAFEVACSPELSVAVMTHSTISVGFTSFGLSVIDWLVPIVVVPTFHA